MVYIQERGRNIKTYFNQVLVVQQIEKGNIGKQDQKSEV